jgi:acyl dehydratase
LELPPAGQIDNLFNVSMSLEPEVLIKQVLSCERMQVTTRGTDEAPRDLGSEDPFVTPVADPRPVQASVEAAREELPGPTKHLYWTLSLLATLLLLSGMFFAAVSFKDV